MDLYFYFEFISEHYMHTWYYLPLLSEIEYFSASETPVFLLLESYLFRYALCVQEIASTNVMPKLVPEVSSDHIISYSIIYHWTI